MENEMLVNFNDIGFAHSTILAYNVSEDNVNLKLECWDGKIFEMNFIKYVSFFSTNYFSIDDFQEVTESFLLERALDEFYEVRPKHHPFRIFKFLHDDITTLEIICEGFNMKEIKT